MNASRKLPFAVLPTTPGSVQLNLMGSESVVDLSPNQIDRLIAALTKGRANAS